jgi:hypothetical protein
MTKDVQNFFEKVICMIVCNDDLPVRMQAVKIKVGG